MTGKDLKNSILQLAIQGKLVPQNPNEEPANELLARIRQEKERLVKEKKLKKKDLETTPITDEEKPFGIPESWEWVRLGELLSVISDGTHKTPNYMSKGIPFLSVQNISKGKLCLDKVKYISQEEHLTLCKRIEPQLDDILVCRIGTLGKAIKVTWDFPFSIFVSLGLLRPINNNIADFLICCINSPIGSGWIDDNKVGGGTHTFKINLGDFPEMLIPLPPLAEQRRIVAKIEELMPLVEEYDKNEQKLEALNKALPEQLRQSVLQQAIMGRLVPQDDNDEPASELLARIRQEKERLVKEKKLKKKDLETTPITDEEKPFEIPESWEWCRLGEIVYNRDSERVPLSISVRQQQHNRKYDYYGPGGAFDKVEGFLFDKRLLLIGEDGANLLTRTKPNAFFAEGKYWVNNHVHVLDSYIDDCMILDYIAMRINGMHLTEYVTGTAQPKMNQEKMNSILIPLPPLAEQQRIVAKIEEMFSVIDNLKTC